MRKLIRKNNDNNIITISNQTNRNNANRASNYNINYNNLSSSNN